MIPNQITPEYRAALAHNVLSALRKAIDANGNEYSGALQPNIQSVDDVLTMPDQMLLRQVKRLPLDMLPTLEQTERFGRWWRTPADAPSPLDL